MIKALLLMFSPVAAWDGIVAAKRQVGFILIAHLLPLLLVTSAVEGWGLVYWGKPGSVGTFLQTFSLRETVAFEIAQGILSFAVVLGGASLVKSLGETFHGRHSYLQAVTTVAYTLSPVYLLRVLNAFPAVSPWIPWAIGIMFSVSILYHGVPRVMQPDPPHAFGLYLISAFLLTMITGLACFLSASYLQGKFTKLNALFSWVTGQS